MRRVLVEELLEVPDHRVGIEIGAVVEFHAAAQLEHPLGLVLRGDVVLFREIGDLGWDLLVLRYVPVDQQVEDRPAGPTEARAALRRLARGRRKLRDADADAQGVLLALRQTRRGDPSPTPRAASPIQAALIREIRVMLSSRFLFL